MSAGELGRRLLGATLVDLAAERQRRQSDESGPPPSALLVLVACARVAAELLPQPKAVELIRLAAGKIGPELPLSDAMLLDAEVARYRATLADFLQSGPCGGPGTVAAGDARSDLAAHRVERAERRAGAELGLPHQLAAVAIAAVAVLPPVLACPLIVRDVDGSAAALDPRQAAAFAAELQRQRDVIVAWLTARGSA